MLNFYTLYFNKLSHGQNSLKIPKRIKFPIFFLELWRNPQKKEKSLNLATLNCSRSCSSSADIKKHIQRRTIPNKFDFNYFKSSFKKKH